MLFTIKAVTSPQQLVSLKALSLRELELSFVILKVKFVIFKAKILAV